MLKNYVPSMVQRYEDAHVQYVPRQQLHWPDVAFDRQHHIMTGGNAQVHVVCAGIQQHAQALFVALETLYHR